MTLWNRSIASSDETMTTTTPVRRRTKKTKTKSTTDDDDNDDDKDEDGDSKDNNHHHHVDDDNNDDDGVKTKTPKGTPTSWMENVRWGGAHSLVWNDTVRRHTHDSLDAVIFDRHSLIRLWAMRHTIHAFPVAVTLHTSLHP